MFRSLASSNLTLRNTKFPEGPHFEERTLISGLPMRMAHPLEVLVLDDQKNWGQSLLHWSLGVQWVSCKSSISQTDALHINSINMRYLISATKILISLLIMNILTRNFEG